MTPDQTRRCQALSTYCGYYMLVFEGHPTTPDITGWIEGAGSHPEPMGQFEYRRESTADAYWDAVWANWLDTSEVSVYFDYLYHGM